MKQGLAILVMFECVNFRQILSVLDGGSASDSRWKLLQKEACYKGKNDFPAKVEINQYGALVAVKLVYISGRMKCANSFIGSYFGCFSDQTLFNLAITDENKIVLFPPPNHAITYIDSSKNYRYPGYLPTDKEVVFTNYAYPTYFKSGDYISIWNYEDLLDYGDTDNFGEVCMDVYGAFV
ncbi:uncharacterized protein LOC105843885 [Hydra vulgaris]|uniref:uncharacterized protein LOC105843885 n=1 Tax=Hydra vulgaris TaxID=6087 RepID=UPI001F5F0A7C|nr:uncharacterized protein LOC105843885 [Hydra vulgaris]XP_047138482.1 uncharacterized protein LOC105843885 [Hydra vulgaris]XP_047138483.1 uncharacterized protein LOC105843885 [Hydra vulgaris]